VVPLIHVVRCGRCLCVHVDGNSGEEIQENYVSNVW
jgi:hypothetical protein